MSSPLPRRDFLKTSGAVALAATSLTGTSLTGTVATAANAPERKIKKAVKLSMVGGNASLTEKFKMLKEVGFEGIDMDQPADHAEVRKAMDASGLIVHGVVDYIHWGKPLSHPDPAVRAEGLEGLKTALKDCKAYGGTTVLLVVGIC
ncbi:MAG: twin-arginine translocation signal domain-containing protein, partial [Planctomycetaceae bacterium]